MNDKKLYFQLAEILVQLHPLGRFGFETFRGQDCGRVFLGQVGSQFADLLGNTNNKNIVSVYFYSGKPTTNAQLFSPAFSRRKCNKIHEKRKQKRNEQQLGITLGSSGKGQGARSQEEAGWATIATTTFLVGYKTTHARVQSYRQSVCRRSRSFSLVGGRADRADFYWIFFFFPPFSFLLFYFSIPFPWCLFLRTGRREALSPVVVRRGKGRNFYTRRLTKREADHRETSRRDRESHSSGRPGGSTTTSRACQTIRLLNNQKKQQGRTNRQQQQPTKKMKRADGWEDESGNLVVVIEILAGAKVRVSRRSDRLETGHSRKRAVHHHELVDAARSTRRRTLRRRVAAAGQGAGREATLLLLATGAGWHVGSGRRA